MRQALPDGFAEFVSWSQGFLISREGSIRVCKGKDVQNLSITGLLQKPGVLGVVYLSIGSMFLNILGKRNFTGTVQNHIR